MDKQGTASRERLEPVVEDLRGHGISRRSVDRTHFPTAKRSP